MEADQWRSKMSVESVVNWANRLDKCLWWRQAIKLAAEKGNLEREDFEFLFTIAKMEHGLEPQTESYTGCIAPLNLTGFGEEKNAVTLKSISQIHHVSALAPETSLEFPANGLTAVYGDNGSGKSSYAKILKNACLTRGDTPQILPNIYKEDRGEPVANISISIGSEQYDVTWKLSDAAQEDLKSIRIFDNTSATHYISNEDIIEYKPTGMKLLSQLMQACSFIRVKCDNEKKQYITPCPLPSFRPNSKTLAFVSTISDKTKPEDVNVFCLSKEQEESIPNYRTELARLKRSTPEQIRKIYSDRCKVLQPLLDHFLKLKSKLDQDNFSAIKDSFDSYKTKLATAEIARSQALDGHELSGICSPEWIAMWNHVKSFIQTHNTGLDFPPTEGTPCPTCLQSISHEASKKLKSFNEYLQNQTQVEATKAKMVFDSFISNLNLLRFDLIPYELSLSMIREHNPEYANKIIELNTNLKVLCDNLTKPEPDFTPIKIEFNAANWINGQINSWRKKEAEVTTNKGLEKQIAELTLLIQDLEDRSLLTSTKQSILDEIKRHQTLTLYNNLSSSCQSTSITSLTTSIAKSGAIGHLQKAFKTELEKLGFKNLDIGTETRGLRGKQMFRLHITGKENRIIEIASEGEQKCIALASFLSELTVDDRKSAIIFDDPINSLDHKWRRKFAKRIAEESLSRQVIVFTHDMPFLKMLEESSDEIRTELNIISIAKYNNLAGFPSSEPPWDAKNTASRVGFLKNLLPTLKKMEMSGNPEYEFKAKHTYNLMRETWERLVEEWLLRKVVERFAREVKTQSLKEIMNDITIEDNDIINAAMSKCSTFMYGHDNATGLAVDCPCYSEIEQDVANLDTYFKQLKKRRT